MSLGKPAKPVKTLPKPPAPERRPLAEGEVPEENLRTPEQYAGEKVVIGVCAPEHVKTKFFASLMGVIRYEQYGTPDSRILDVHLAQPGARIAYGRNLLVESFLKSDADWLIQLDYDLTFSPDVLDLWLSAAHPEDRPIAQMLYFGILNEELVPFAYLSNGHDSPYAFRPFMPAEKSVTMCDAVASGATIVHRSVYEQMRERYEPEFKPYTWYGEYGTPDGREVTEDIIFSVRAREMGFGMCVDTRHVMGHLKERVVGFERI